MLNAEGWTHNDALFLPLEAFTMQDNSQGLLFSMLYFIIHIIPPEFILELINVCILSY